MQNKMLAICPSFKRPEMCATMIESYLATKARHDQVPEGWSDMIIGLSANDPKIEEYKKFIDKYGVKVQVFNTNSTTKIFNQIWKENRNYSCYHTTNDDLTYLTEGWDCVFVDILLQRGGGIVFGDDMFHGSGLCTLPCISSNVVEALGWLQYNKLDKLFGDAVWHRLGLDCECIYYHDDIKLEHKHWINGKREKDETANDYLSGYRQDEFVFNYWCKNFKDRDVLKVKKVLNNENPSRV